MWNSWRSYGERCCSALWEPYHGDTWWAGTWERGYSSHIHLLSLHLYSKMCPELGIWVWTPKSMFIQCHWLGRNFHPLEERGLLQSSPREGRFPTRCSLPGNIVYLISAGLYLSLQSLSEGRYSCVASCLPGSAFTMPRLIKWIFLGWWLFLDCVVGWYAQIR